MRTSKNLYHLLFIKTLRFKITTIKFLYFSGILLTLFLSICIRKAFSIYILFIFQNNETGAINYNRPFTIEKKKYITIYLFMVIHLKNKKDCPLFSYYIFIVFIMFIIELFYLY